MRIHEITAKSLLRRQKKIDSWFVSRYGMNLYRGCSHNCVYCDGRAEKYRVDGEFGLDVSVKTNALQLLRRELDPTRKRAPFKGGFVLVGGGVCDSYEPAEAQYRLTRGALELLLEFGFPVHTLTKSTLIERDMDLIGQINEKNRAIVGFSFSSVDDAISAVFEPSVPRPSKRLATLQKLKKAGIACGMFLMPVIPFITDTPEKMDESVKAARDAGLDFIVFAGMTLKDGRQKDYFLNALSRYRAELVSKYELLYSGNQWGEPRSDYMRSIHERFFNIARKYKMPIRIPARLFSDILDDNDRVVVMLEQIDYVLKMLGRESHYGYAAYSVSQLKEPLSHWRGRLQQLRGIGPTTERLIHEILDTGKCDYYDKLVGFSN
jgi:DNA repair photolyase